MTTSSIPTAEILIKPSTSPGSSSDPPFPLWVLDILLQATSRRSQCGYGSSGSSFPPPTIRVKNTARRSLRFPRMFTPENKETLDGGVIECKERQVAITIQQCMPVYLNESRWLQQDYKRRRTIYRRLNWVQQSSLDIPEPLLSAPSKEGNSTTAHVQNGLSSVREGSVMKINALLTILL
nr:hypothetical protein HmN_000953700 [Hymenolepis microstoma]